MMWSKTPCEPDNSVSAATTQALAPGASVMVVSDNGDFPSRCTPVVDRTTNVTGYLQDIAVACCGPASTDPAVNMTQNISHTIWKKGFGFACTTGRTFDEAQKICEESATNYNRLCTQQELEQGTGQNQSCAWNHYMIWSSTTCNEAPLYDQPLTR